MDGWKKQTWSKIISTDYHDEMNSEHFLEWMTEELLPTLDEPSVIILDNAKLSQQTVKQTYNNTKQKR